MVKVNRIMITAKVLDLSSEGYTILHWLSVLMANRKVRLSTPTMRRGHKWLLENFPVNIEEYDIIKGYRADDSYFAFARAYMNNEITLGQLNHAMHLGKLGEQIILKSPKAFDVIKFVSYDTADNSIYYPKRKARDEDARAAYLSELEKLDKDGVYLSHLLNEEVTLDDERLRHQLFG